VELRRRQPAGARLAHWRLEDLIGEATYDRDGDDLMARGLYLDALPWQASVFSLTRRS